MAKHRAFPLLLALLLPGTLHALEPLHSFDRLVSSNGHGAVSFNGATSRVDTFLEHPYRFASPRNAPPDLCFAADESRDLAYDMYFGVRTGSGQQATGQWLGELPLVSAAYEPGTGIIRSTQHLGPSNSITADVWTFMPMGVDLPVVVSVLRLENTGSTNVQASAYSLFNFHLGSASGGRDPTANAEEVAWDQGRSTFYEYSAQSAGTAAYTLLGTDAAARRSTSPGAAGVYNALVAKQDLDNVSSTTGPVTDVSPGFQSGVMDLAPGVPQFVAVAMTWALDEDAGPKVDVVKAWAAGRTAQQLVQGEMADWDAWHTMPPAALTAGQVKTWRQQAAFLRMSQVKDAGKGFGQILASLPPGLGNPNSQWNITWVRDMAYAVAGLARSGHLAEAKDAILFQLGAGPGRHTLEVGGPYRLSVTRYFGNGEEESDCNQDGPNIEFDGFGLFLWSLGEYVRAGGDVEAIRAAWPGIRTGVADVLVNLQETSGVVKADSSIWEVHWNGKQRHFTYTSLAAAKGLCDAAVLASLLGETADAARYSAAGAKARDGVVTLHRDANGVLAQSSEDLARGTGYLDAATVEAINWGVVDPAGVTALASLDALQRGLQVPSGMGFKRNDDGDAYDSQEWVFVDLRLVPALRAAGRMALADSLLAWVEGQAAANDQHIAELHDATSGAYAGSIPMAGFGAGAYLLAVDGTAPFAACGAFGPDVMRPDAGTSVDAAVVMDAAAVMDAAPNVDAAAPTDASASMDAGAVLDAAVTLVDAAVVLVDAAVAQDSGTPVDAAVLDAGVRDAAMITLDAAQATDAAVSIPDAAVPASDASVVASRDAAVVAADASTSSPPPSQGPCACASVDGAGQGFATWLVVAMGLLVRRRSRRATRQ